MQLKTLISLTRRNICSDLMFSWSINWLTMEGMSSFHHSRWTANTYIIQAGCMHTRVCTVPVQLTYQQQWLTAATMQCFSPSYLSVAQASAATPNHSLQQTISTEYNAYLVHSVSVYGKTTLPLFLYCVCTKRTHRTNQPSSATMPQQWQHTDVSIQTSIFIAWQHNTAMRGSMFKWNYFKEVVQRCFLVVVVEFIQLCNRKTK